MALSRNKALRLAIEALVEKNKKYAVHANLVEMGIGKPHPPGMIKDHQRYKENAEAIQALEYMLKNKQLELL